MANYVRTITKDEINDLPLIKFEGEIVVINDKHSFKRAIKRIKQEGVLGFDTESRPSFKKGTSYPVSLLQLATAETAYLFQLHLYPLQAELVELLSSADHVKAGVAIHDDIKGLQKLYPFEPQGFVELVNLTKQRGITNSGLRALTAIILQGRISKKAQLSNWSKKQYDESQLNYAATDAWVGYRIYKQLID